MCFLQFLDYTSMCTGIYEVSLKIVKHPRHSSRLSTDVSGRRMQVTLGDLVAGECRMP